jgi:DNA-binding response OmpR family regulator/two-component sensor histidine kinase
MDDESKGKLKLVKRNADQLLKLINQILDFRKLESGKYKISYTKADLLYFVNSIVESFQGMAAEKKIDLVFTTELSHFFTWFDSDKMQKILNNLLSNALKFTGEKGRVEVSFDVVNNLAMEGKGDSAHYFISVKDSGKGISEKNLKGIFERFFQGNNSAETTGSGIGLSITREFIKMMDGDIDVESKEGHGSTFCVRLPVLSDADISDEGAQQINVDDSSEESIQNGVGGENKRIILITEDNADVREYVASHFRGDCRVLEAENGKEAYELAVKYIPDIIISDLLMPVMNGSAFCKKIKKDERTSHIPFILLTAVTSKESEKEAFMAGADDYITKPFDIQILRMKVDNLISLRDTLKEKYKNDMLLQPSNVTLVSPDEKFLKKAVDTVEKYMSDPDLDIEKFASEVGVSRMQLYRKLEALTNMTVKEFIRDIRIKRAAQLLEQNKASVSEIVYQVGFRDLAYFRKCFREQYGTSPSEYAAKFK